MPKIHSTRRTVQTNTPRLQPPSTAGFGATGRATQQLGKAISSFAGVFDAFDKANEQNDEARFKSDWYKLQIDADKEISDFGNTYQGDGKGYVNGAGSIYDTKAKDFQSRYQHNPRLAQKAEELTLRGKIPYQRKALTKGQQIQRSKSVLESAEIAQTMREGMLSDENLKTQGLGIVREATTKFYGVVDNMPISQADKTAIKEKWVNDSAKHVEEKVSPGELLNWKAQKEKELQAQKQDTGLTPDEIQRLEKETGLKRSKAGKVEDRGWPIEDNDPRLKKYKQLEGEVLSSKAKPKTNNKISQNAVKMIYGEEGLRLKAYLDPVGVPTIGYGHTKGVKLGQTITKEQAVQLAQQDIKEFENAVDRNIKVPLTQNQYDALVSFTFNLGEGNLKKIAGDINAGNFAKAAKRMLSYNKARDRRTGQLKRLPGLVSRRKREANLFMQKDGRKVAVSSFVQRKEQDVGSQIFSKIDWDKVEKRHEAEQEQVFLQGVVNGEIKVSAHNSSLMKRYNKAHESILGPEVSLIDNDEAKDYVLKMAVNKAPLPKQVFEKLTGHIESEAPEERAKGYALLDNIERDNRAQFSAGGKHANNLSKKLAVYRKLSSFYGNDGAVRRMMLSEERFAKMGIDEMKAEKNKFLKDLDVDDIGDEFDSIFSSQPDVGFSAQQKATVTSEYKTLAADAFNQTGDADAAKAIAMHEIKKRYGTTEITGESVVMKYPPEKFVHPDNIDHVRDNFKAISGMVVDLNKDSFAARGYELTGKAALSSDHITERSAEGYFDNKKKPESFLAMDGISLQTEVPDGPKWRIMLEAKVNGETFFVPVDHYFEIDGTAQADHDRLMQFELDNRAIRELELEKNNLPQALGGERGHSPNAPHNLLRRLGGKDPSELVKKREEIKNRESIENQGVPEQ